MTTHELKTWPPFYAEVESGVKTAEVRFDDRGYAVGDTLILREWDQDVVTVDDHPLVHPGAYTGRACVRYVTHILDGGVWGIKPGFVVLSVSEHPEEVPDAD